MIQKSVPLISDEAMSKFSKELESDEWLDPWSVGANLLIENASYLSLKHARDIYEADRSKQLAEISTLRKSLEECVEALEGTLVWLHSTGKTRPKAEAALSGAKELLDQQK